MELISTLRPEIRKSDRKKKGEMPNEKKLKMIGMLFVMLFLDRNSSDKKLMQKVGYRKKTEAGII